MPPIVTAEVELMTFQCLSFQEDIKESVCLKSLLGEVRLGSGETSATLSSRQVRTPFPFGDPPPQLKNTSFSRFPVEGACTMALAAPVIARM